MRVLLLLLLKHLLLQQQLLLLLLLLLLRKALLCGRRNAVQQRNWEVSPVSCLLTSKRQKGAAAAQPQGDKQQKVSPRYSLLSPLGTEKKTKGDRQVRSKETAPRASYVSLCL